jgi:outer membrane protein OmpA-like peptidoglycan-associated protein
MGANTTRGFLAGLALAGALAAGCGAKPFPDPLQSLDELTRGPVALQIDVDLEQFEDDARVLDYRTRALDMYRASLVYHEYAVDAHKKNNGDKAELLARVGLIYFSAAENFYRSAEARETLMDSNRRFEDQRIRRNDYADRLASENELIGLLTTIEELFEANAELRRQLASFEEAARSESQAMYAIQEARILQREAEGMRANVYAGEDFDRATATLARALASFDAGTYPEAQQLGFEALEQYRRAIEAARPRFMEDSDRLLNNPENRELFDNAQRVFGPQQTVLDSRGIVVVLPALFPAGSSEIDDTKAFLVDQVLNLLTTQASRTIVIEGHTSDNGAPEQNLALSERRADTVRAYLERGGVRARRMSAESRGEDQPRYDNRDAATQLNNDRVEIIFLFD